MTIATDFNPIWVQLARGAVKYGVKYGIPIVGALVDFAMQKDSGESTGDALIKTGAHTVIGAVCMAIGGPLGFGVNNCPSPSSSDCWCGYRFCCGFSNFSWWFNDF